MAHFILPDTPQLKRLLDEATEVADGKKQRSISKAAVEEYNKLTHFAKQAKAMLNAPSAGKTGSGFKAAISKSLEVYEKEILAYVDAQIEQANEMDEAYQSEYHGGMSFAFNEVRKLILEIRKIRPEVM